MGIIGTYLSAGAMSLASGTTCIATGISPACIMACGWMPITAVSLPTALISRTGATLILTNPNGAAANGEGWAVYAHSVIQ